jgi:hypothetical protein
MFVTRSASVPPQAKCTPALGTVGKFTATTGERASSSSRELSYTEVGAAYDWVVAGDGLKERQLVCIATNQPKSK